MSIIITELRAIIQVQSKNYLEENKKSAFQVASFLCQLA